MKKSGVALMGSGIAEGENRAYNAIEMAINSPLLNDNNIKGAQNILLYFASGSSEATMDEITEITDFILREAGPDVDIIWGAGTDDSLGDKLSITLVATGFDKNHKIDFDSPRIPEKIVHNLEKEKVEEKPIETKVETPQSQTQQEEFLNDIKILEKTEVKESVIFTIENTTESKPEPKQPSYSQPNKGNEDEFYVFTKPETKTETVVNIKQDTSFKESDITETEIDKKSNERIQRLKDLSTKLRTPEGLSELENSPAYVRRNVVLSNVTLSSESEISRFTLSENDDKKVEIKSNNSYLHDNVD